VIDLKEKRRQDGCSGRIVSKYRLLIWERDQRFSERIFSWIGRFQSYGFKDKKRFFLLAKIIQQKKSSSWYSLINEDFDNTFWEADQKVSTRKLFWERKVSRF
jgi:hypothetical protein